MKLAIIGGGGFRVPLVVGALARSASDGNGVVDAVDLYDIDRSALHTMDAVLAGQRRAFPPASGRGHPRIATTTDLDSALDGADVVFSAIRVGGLRGRARDERTALSIGVLGQETVGAGGLSYALRTLPVTNGLARRIAEKAPGAWLINFTNPAGIVTEAARRYLGDRVIGICDSPVGLIRRASRAAGIDAQRATADYAGLNHLGWLNALTVDGVDRLPGLLASPAVTTFEEGRLLGERWLRMLGSLPNEYLDYYYRPSETLRAVRQADATRGEQVERDAGGFFARTGRDTPPDEAYRRWLAFRQSREEGYLADSRAAADAGERDKADISGGGYEDVALELMRRLTGSGTAGAEGTPGTAGADDGAAGDAVAPGDELILNIPSNGAVDCVPPDAVVEVPCTVGASGARPARRQPLSLHQTSLVTAVKAAEREVIDAVDSGSRRAAERAFAFHPLIASAPLARQLLDVYIDAFPALHEVLPRR